MMMEQPANVFMIYNHKEDFLVRRIFNKRGHAKTGRGYRRDDCDIKEFMLVEVLDGQEKF